MNVNNGGNDYCELPIFIFWLKFEGTLAVLGVVLFIHFWLKGYPQIEGKDECKCKKGEQDLAMYIHHHVHPTCLLMVEELQDNVMKKEKVVNQHQHNANDFSPCFKLEQGPRCVSNVLWGEKVFDVKSFLQRFYYLLNRSHVWFVQILPQPQNAIH
eukprot:m.132470 g.132470  ORF g.132470 m.132470 type:complete len:156 (-) comp9486_c0_seq1:335-802(-)